MDSTFRSCSELKTLFGSINYSLNIAQITQGSLHGRLIVYEGPGIAIIQLKSNQGLIFNGDVNSSVISFAIESSDNIELHRVQGIAITNHTLSGFNINKSEHYFSTTPNSNLYIIFFPKIKFLQAASQIEGEQAIDFFHNQNHKSVNPCKFNKILNYAKQLKSTSSINQASYHHDLIISILDSLICCENDCKSNIHPLPNRDLVHKFVKYAFAEGQQKPLTLNDLTTNLFSSKTVLSTAIKKSTGLSPLVFLRNLRLEQVRSSLLDPDSSTSVIEVASKYGFSSRGHFSRYYKNLFGELPSETLSHLP